MKIRNKNLGREIVSPDIKFIENFKGTGNDVFIVRGGIYPAGEGKWEKVEETDEWQPIERDKNGFALNNSLDKIFDKVPVEVLFDDKNNGELSIELITDNCDIYGYRGDIERKTYYTHYRRIELPKK